MKSRVRISEDDLQELYVNKKIKPKEIAERYQCSLDLIYYYLKKYGITKRSKVEDLTGKRFGLLTIEKLYGKTKTGSAIWECRCECGNVVFITSYNIKKRKSCGCRKATGNKKHGLSNSRPYSVWRGIVTRCTNPKAINYHNYGKRGISIDPKWKTFSGFWDDMKDGYKAGLTIDRIDYQGDYTKSNCRWITPKEQNKNMRSNKLITYNGKTQSVNEWAEELCVKRSLLYYYKQRGFTDKDAIDKAIYKYNKLER